MSELTKTFHNLEDLLTGKTDFAGFRDGEIAMFEKDIAKLPVVIQGAADVLLNALEVGASSLVGAGLTALGPLLAQSNDALATQLLNLLSAAGVPTNRALTAAEHAALMAIIAGFKAGLDRLGLQITTQGVQVEDEAPKTAVADSDQGDLSPPPPAVTY